MLHMERLPSDFLPPFFSTKKMILSRQSSSAGKDFGRETTTEVLETAKVGVPWMLDLRFVALAASFFLWRG